MSGSDKVGRQGSTGTFANTIAPKSAEQAMLLKMDEMIAAMNSLRTALETAADTAAINAAAAALDDIEKVKLVR